MDTRGAPADTDSRPRADPVPHQTSDSAVAQRILDAVEGLLATGLPYTALSMQRIAAAAGLARSTVYRYFPQKNCLLIRLVDADTEDGFAPEECWWAQWRADDLAALTDALAALLEYRRNRGHILGALAEVAAYDRGVARYHAERTARLSDRVADSLRKVRVVASLPADRASALIIVAMVERTAELYSALDPPVAPASIATALGKAVMAVAAG
ncbi:TetR/AcrR family transcriptional regulator [Nocardia sp. NPDC058499]|uniref:TetR/AcrR family transcriptional regulator n=1 Tax=Nocardia sp. NPDC058499 TaxID=3346530 RepID=UPI003650667A